MEPTLTALFDLSANPYPELFAGCTYPWEVVSRISGFLGARPSGTMAGSVHPQAVVSGTVEIGEGTVVEAGAVIIGPAVIGKNCVIRAHAYLRGDVVISDNATIGHSVEIKNSIILAGAAVAHFNYVGDSIIGNKAHLAGGSILANTKLPPAEVIVRDGDAAYRTGREKFGAAVGDQAEIGCNAVLNPGSIIGPHSIIYPLVSWRGVLPARMLAKAAGQVVPRT